MTIQNFATIMQLLVSIGTLTGMIVALKKVLSAPSISKDKRLIELEIKIKDIEESLKQGNDKFRELYETTEISQSCILALIDFEIQYCISEKVQITDELKESRKKLHEFVVKNKKY